MHGHAYVCGAEGGVWHWGAVLKRRDMGPKSNARSFACCSWSNTTVSARTLQAYEAAIRGACVQHAKWKPSIASRTQDFTEDGRFTTYIMLDSKHACKERQLIGPAGLEVRASDARSGGAPRCSSESARMQQRIFSRMSAPSAGRGSARLPHRRQRSAFPELTTPGRVRPPLRLYMWGPDYY